MTPHSAPFTARVAALSDPDLGTRLILDPGTAFATVHQAFRDLGFTLDEHDASPLQEEPALAAWSINGARPFAVYSFNPVVRLRVLDVGLLTSQQRQALAMRLPVLARQSLRALLNSPSGRMCLLAIWAMVELEDIDSLPLLVEQGRVGDGPIADEARRAADRLAAIDAARAEVLGGMRMVAAAGRSIIAALATPTGKAVHLAQPADCDLLFTADIATDIAVALTDSPLDPGDWSKGQVMTDGDITAAPAGLLRGPNLLSQAFPLGWRDMAGWLQPDVIWLCWRARTDAGTLVSMDGLAFTGQRWIWFPRGYRAVMNAVRATTAQPQ